MNNYTKVLTQKFQQCVITAWIQIVLLNEVDLFNV